MLTLLLVQQYDVTALVLYKNGTIVFTFRSCLVLVSDNKMDDIDVLLFLMPNSMTFAVINLVASLKAYNIC